MFVNFDLGKMAWATFWAIFLQAHLVTLHSDNLQCRSGPRCPTPSKVCTAGPRKKRASCFSMQTFSQKLWTEFLLQGGKNFFFVWKVFWREALILGSLWLNQCLVETAAYFVSAKNGFFFHFFWVSLAKRFRLNLNRVARVFAIQYTKNGGKCTKLALNFRMAIHNIYQMTVIYLTILNGHKIYQMTVSLGCKLSWLHSLGTFMLGFRCLNFARAL
jgi:hypothetical protein